MELDFSQIPRPARSCADRPFAEEPLRWPRTVLALELDGAPYEFRPMHRDEVGAVRDLFAVHYPQLYRSSRHGLLEEAFYHEAVALLPDWDAEALEKPGFVGVVAPRGGHDPLFAALYLKDPYDPVIQLCAAILAPAARGKGLTRYYAAFTNLLLEQSTAEYAFATPHVKDTLIQELARAGGFKAAGVLPGAFRWACDERSYYRDAVVYIYKFLRGAERHSTAPGDWRLSPGALAEIEALSASVDRGNRPR